MNSIAGLSTALRAGLAAVVVGVGYAGPVTGMMVQLEAEID